MPTDSINLTPRGLLTEEGHQRCATAAETMANTKSSLANFFIQLCRELAGTANHVDQARCLHRALARPGLSLDERELADLLKADSAAQEEFLRSLTGAPKRA